MSYEKAALLWDARESRAKTLKSCPIVAEGAAAHASERAAGERALVAKCRQLWGVVVTDVTVETDVDDGAEEDREDEILHFSTTADPESDVEAGDHEESDNELM